jgi:hypothetical protein
MGLRAIVALFMVLAPLAGCSSDGAPLETGLAGVVMRGPIAPVCVDNEPCDAPFAATFVVSRNGRDVTSFRTASDGRFELLLAPGAYRITPSADAPIISPATQGQDVAVGTSGLTTDTLHFDTGIR